MLLIQFYVFTDSYQIWYIVNHNLGEVIELVQFDFEQLFSRYQEKHYEGKPFGIFKKEPKIAIMTLADPERGLGGFSPSQNGMTYTGKKSCPLKNSKKNFDQTLLHFCFCL